MGPFFLTDMLGLDTVLKVAQHLRESYGDRFYVHKGMEELVAAGNLGRRPGRGSMSTAADTQTDAATLVERFSLKALVESCLVLEEGVATIRDIDLGDDDRVRDHPAAVRARRRPGAGRRPGRARARARPSGGSTSAAADPPPPGRPGSSGQEGGAGLLPLSAARRRAEEGEPVKLETRGGIAIAWLGNPPANSISPD